MTLNLAQKKKHLFTFATIAAILLLSSVRTEGRSAQSAEMEEMRRELRQLRSQIQTLRAAMSEAAELDRQKAAVFARALKGIPGGPESVVGTGTTRNESAEPAAAAAPSMPAPSEPAMAPTPAPAPARRVSSAPAPDPAVGTIKGKVAVPRSEPVAYVYVENVLAPAVKGQRVVIEQVGKKFVPSWAVVQRGTAISFPNLDNVYHNVFSLSSGNSFDLGLYNSANEAKSRVFSEPGAVDIYCNIHPQMAASALVVPNRFFSKVKADGSFEIAGVPRGRRKVVAWAPGAQLTADWAEVETGRTTELTLKLVSKASGHLNKAGQQYGSYE